ncbi:MAG: NUDIX hydrolase [Candidatus Nealsonbacteria bacterium]
MINKKWQELISELIIGTPFFKLFKKDFRLPDGMVIKDYYLIEKTPSVHIAAITNEKKIVLIKHYRPGFGEVSIELPAGLIETQETAAAAGKRELLEETGYKTDNLSEISNFSQDTSRFTGCACHLFLAQDLQKIKRGRLSQEAKEIEVVEISISEAIEMIKNGQIKDLPTIAGLLLVRLFIYLLTGLGLIF